MDQRNNFDIKLNKLQATKKTHQNKKQYDITVVSKHSSVAGVPSGMCQILQCYWSE